MLLLSACATKVYKTELEIYCPPIVEYSEEFNESLVEELISLPVEDFAIERTISDYVRLRDLIKVCVTERDNLENGRRTD